jgi:hypothetical protein
VSRRKLATLPGPLIGSLLKALQGLFVLRIDPRLSQRRARIALATMVCALCTLLAPSISWATSAPMCDELAQSIEAPPTIWPFQGGTLDAVVECPGSAQATHSSSIPERAQVSIWPCPREAPLSTASLSEAPPSSQRLAIPHETTFAKRPGYGKAIYRPPR